MLLALVYQILLKLDGAKCGHMIYLRRGISLPPHDPPVDLALPKLTITKFSYPSAHHLWTSNICMSFDFQFHQFVAQ